MRFPLIKLQNIVYLLLLALLYCLSASIVYLAFNSSYIADESYTLIRWCILLLLLPLLFKYLVQILTLCCYRRVERSRKRRHQFVGTPKVSVLIPAYNEEVGIVKTINSVIANDYGNVEVIVINDGSTDKTGELVQQLVLEHTNTKKLRYLSITNSGKANALNEGLALCHSDYIFTIDADCIMDREAITNTLQRFADPKVGAVGGNVVVANKSKPVELLQQLEYLYGFFFKRVDSAFNSVYIIGGAAAAYRKSVLDEVGGFDGDVITEDIEMSMRILAAGHKTRYASNAVTYTEGPSRWRCLFNQRLRWRFGRFQTFIKYQKLFFSRQQGHNRYFTMLLLPIALYAELALLFQGFFLAFFYSYTFVTHDYWPVVFVMGFMTLMVILQVIFDNKSRFHLNLLLLAPVAWIVFYVIDIIEFQALFRSLKRLIKQQGLEWQRWSRVGIITKR